MHSCGRIGSEDIAMQCRKIDSGHIVSCYRTEPLGHKWPSGIEERPLLTKVYGNTIHFKDGTTAEVDVIILCTGYLYNFPYMSESLRLKGIPDIHLVGLYKGTVWMDGGNNKLMYLGIQGHYYSFTLFDIRTEWACAVIAGQLKLPQRKEMESNIEKWQKKQNMLKGCYDEIAYQTKFVCDIARQVGCKYNLDVSALFNKYEDNRYANVATYRDQTYSSVFTGKPGIKHHIPWFNAFDYSLETFVTQPQNKDKKQDWDSLRQHDCFPRSSF